MTAYHRKSGAGKILAFALAALALTGCVSQSATWDKYGNKMVVQTYSGTVGQQEIIRKQLPGGYSFYSEACKGLTGKTNITIIRGPDGRVVPEYEDMAGNIWKSNAVKEGHCGPGDVNPRRYRPSWHYYRDYGPPLPHYGRKPRREPTHGPSGSP